MAKLSKFQIEVLEGILRQTDEGCIKLGLPPLSVIVNTDDGVVTPVFWETVEKYNLRHENESDTETYERIQKECFATKYPDELTRPN